MSDRIEKSITLRAPVERVWRALTDHEQFNAWFGVGLDGPFGVGKTVQGPILGTCGGSHDTPSDTRIVMRCTVVAMEKPRLFSWRWHPYAIDPAADYTAETPTLVEFHLGAEGAGTRLTVVESGFDALPAARRDLAFRMNENGWGKQLENLGNHVDA